MSIWFYFRILNLDYKIIFSNSDFGKEKQNKTQFRIKEAFPNWNLANRTFIKHKIKKI